MCLVFDDFCHFNFSVMSLHKMEAALQALLKVLLYNVTTKQ